MFDRMRQAGSSYHLVCAGPATIYELGYKIASFLKD